MPVENRKYMGLISKLQGGPHITSAIRAVYLLVERRMPLYYICSMITDTPGCPSTRQSFITRLICSMNCVADGDSSLSLSLSPTLCCIHWQYSAERRLHQQRAWRDCKAGDDVADYICRKRAELSGSWQVVYVIVLRLACCASSRVYLVDKRLSNRR